MAVIDNTVTALALPFSLREKVPAGRTPRRKHPWGVRAGEAGVVNNIGQQPALDNRLQFADMATLPLTPTLLPPGEGLGSRSAA